MIYEIPRGVIVLEGPDACGKTTLARTILERHGGKYIHLRYQGANTMKWNFAALRRAVRYCPDMLVVIDRHWLSEQIYSAVYRDGKCDNHAAKQCMGFLHAIGAVYVFCLPSVESCVNRHAVMHNTGRELYTPDVRIAQVAEYYWQALRGLPSSSSSTHFPSRIVLDDLGKDGGMLRYSQDKILLYDVDSDGDFVVDVADSIVAKTMAPRCHAQPN